ncbi:ATP-binding protein [Massilibacteroides sp.]|uniref:hybrid sensor histidine kinase/response regulator n=1 Tax=Massilibacteroides sp. TaxID=2034766 RepID=UPI00260A3203|nr:ATP-binding protein [Massilibacteroides sp.]MDD4515048.1 ATP-binding protein [Massilibacteroides sp.]
MKKNNLINDDKNKHLTLKVISGYTLFAIVAFGSIFYILHLIKAMNTDDGSEQQQRERAYLITRTISLLNESAAIGQPIGMTQEHFDLFNETMDETQECLDELRLMLTDSFHVQGVDTIGVLIENKRLNTEQLYVLWQDMSSDKLYDKQIKKIASDTVVTKVDRTNEIETKRDSVVIARKKKGFFKRLADAFVPPKEDVGVVIKTISNSKSDSTINIYDPKNGTSDILKEFREKMDKERKQLNYKLYDKAAELRHNNALINTRINQILYAIEEEEMDASIEKMAAKQKLYTDSTRIMGVVAIAAILIIIGFVLVISRDISKSKYYRRQLEKAKQYAEELLVKQEKVMLTISHDIRAPLSSILGYVELLLKRKPDERQRYYLENMSSSSNHILSLVNDLLDFHRLDSGKMEIQKVPFNIKPLFDDIFASFKPIADAKKLTFSIDMDEVDMDLTYLGDTIRIRQIVSNLLSNAIKFTNEGEVRMSVRIRDKQLCLSVSDTGQGIPEEEQAGIFGEFTRLKKEKAEGFGLGLSITRKLVELMGGSISLESTVGKGSVFYLDFPLEEVEKNTTGSSPEPIEEKVSDIVANGRVINCLLVDDDPLQLALTEELLKQSLVIVKTCTDPRKVLDLLREQKYDIVITDIQMPGLNGFELVGQIRESGISGTDVLPVIALSASVANEKETYFDAGFTGFLNKPFTAKELIAVLNDILSTDLQMDTKLDFTSLTDFAGGDKEALNSILSTFESETSENVKRLNSTLEQTDRDKASKIAHKMIPVFSMIGANSLVQRLRLLEKNDEELSDSAWRSLIQELNTQIEVVMMDVAEQKCGL